MNLSWKRTVAFLIVSTVLVAWAGVNAVESPVEPYIDQPDKEITLEKGNTTVEWWTTGNVSYTRSVDIYITDLETVRKRSGNPSAYAATIRYTDWDGTQEVEIWMPHKGTRESLYFLCSHEKQHAIRGENQEAAPPSHSPGFKNTYGSHPKCRSLINNMTVTK